MKWKKCDVLIYIKKSRSANPQLSVLTYVLTCVVVGTTPNTI